MDCFWNETKITEIRPLSDVMKYLLDGGSTEEIAERMYKAVKEIVSSEAVLSLGTRVNGIAAKDILPTINGCCQCRLLYRSIE